MTPTADHPSMLRRLLTAAILLIGVAGLPVLLYAAAGSPSFDGLGPATLWGWVRDGISDQYLPIDPLLRLLTLAGWGLYLYFAAVVVLRAVALGMARHQLAGSAALLAATDLVTARWLRGLVDATIGVALLTSGITRPAAAVTHPPAPSVVQVTQAAQPGAWLRAPRLLAEVRQAPATHAQPADPSCDPPELGRREQPPARRSPEYRLYVVRPGDSLWRITERHTGDGNRYPELYELNRGRQMPDGRVLDEPGFIRPGWELRLPPAWHKTSTATEPGRAPDPGSVRSEPEPERPSTSTSTTTTTRTPTPANSAQSGSQPTSEGSPRPSARHAPVIEFPGGSILAISVAVAVTAALTMARLRRRRRRVPQPPRAGIGFFEPGIEPTTKQVERLTIPYTNRPPAELAALFGDEDNHDPTAMAPSPVAFTPPDPRSPQPARVVIAVTDTDHTEVPVDLAAFGAISLTGPDALDLAHAAIVALLASDGPTAVQVILAGPNVLPEVPDFPGLNRADDLPSALDELEAEIVHRTRLLELEDLDHFASHRQEHPDDPLPAIVLVATKLAPADSGRLAAVLAQGPRLGIGAVLAGIALPDAARIALDDTGRVAAARPGALSTGQLVGARACRLTAPEATDLLTTVARSRSDDLDVAHGALQTTTPDQASTIEQPSAAETPGPPAALSKTPPADPDPQALPATEREQPPPPPIAVPASQPVPAPIRVRLFGPHTIAVNGNEVRSGLRGRARELLIHFLLHPEGATLAQAADTMWPEALPKQIRPWTWTAIGNLRGVLRDQTGIPQGKFIERNGEFYQPQTELFSVDLWDFETALATAEHAATVEETIEALGLALDAYRGPFLDGVDQPWVEPIRQDLRNRAVDAAARLADLYTQAGDHTRAVAAFEHAIENDPYAEELYRRLMRLHAADHQPDAVQRTYQRLRRALGEIDEEPDETTDDLVAQLTAKPNQKPTRRTA